MKEQHFSQYLSLVYGMFVQEMSSTNNHLSLKRIQMGCNYIFHDKFMSFYVTNVSWAHVSIGTC